jgi:Cu2+-exporting ATPase
VTNNVAAIGALANGIWPMRQVAHLEAERCHLLELELQAAGYDPESREASAA